MLLQRINSSTAASFSTGFNGNYIVEWLPCSAHFQGFVAFKRLQLDDVVDMMTADSLPIFAILPTTWATLVEHSSVLDVFAVLNEFGYPAGFAQVNCVCGRIVRTSEHKLQASILWIAGQNSAS